MYVNGRYTCINYIYHEMTYSMLKSRHILTILYASLLFVGACKKEINKEVELPPIDITGEVPSLSIVNEADRAEWFFVNRNELGCVLAFNQEINFEGKEYVPGLYFLVSDFDFANNRVSVIRIEFTPEELKLFYQEEGHVIIMVRDDMQYWLYETFDDGQNWMELAYFNREVDHKYPVGYSISGDVIVMFSHEFVTRIFHLKDGVETRTNTFFGYDAFDFDNEHTDYAIIARKEEDSINGEEKSYVFSFGAGSNFFEGPPVTHSINKHIIINGNGYILPDPVTKQFIFSNIYGNAWQVRSEFPRGVSRPCALAFSKPYPMGWKGSWEDIQIYCLVYDGRAYSTGTLYNSTDLGRTWNQISQESGVRCVDMEFAQYKNELQLLFDHSTLYLSAYKEKSWVQIHTY